MELHESLYALGLRLGREVFDDPETFRGALDDFLDEDAATTGDINLLVDAVRLGSFSSMATMLDSGAQVTAAVEEAGHRLARDRGSSDVTGAQWACAVLGFAIGRVTDADVRRYRTQHAGPPPSQQMPPTQLPGTPPTQQRPVAPTPTAQPPYPPTPPAQMPPPGSWPGGPAARKRRTWPILVAAVVAVAVIAGGAAAVIATTGGDDDNGGGGGGDRSPSATEVAVDLESVQERYAGLGEEVTAGLDECDAAEAADGAGEVLECGFANGTLTLTTYESEQDLIDHRDATATLDPGSRYAETDAGTLYAVSSASAVSDAGASSLYWDSSAALQSGQYVASSDTVTIEQLVEQYGAVGSAVEYPTKPQDEGMIELAQEFVDIDKCDRIETIQAGELEESICTGPKDIFVFIGVFKELKDFRDYRRNATQQARDQGHNDFRTWNFGDGPREGTLADYINTSGEAVRYWDKPECRCYMEANLDNGDLDTLIDWWINA